MLAIKHDVYELQYIQPIEFLTNIFDCYAKMSFNPFYMIHKPS